MARPTADLDRAVAFYRDTLDLTLVARFDPPGLAFFDLMGVRLLLERSAGEVRGEAGVLYLWADDLGQAHRELLERGVRFEHDPQLVHRDDDGTFGPAGSEEWMVFFRDPDAHLLALASRVTPDS